MCLFHASRPQDWQPLGRLAGVHIALSVSELVSQPSDSIRFILFNVWFFLLLEQVFGHEVKNSVDTLLGIVLTIALKGDIVLTQDSFEKIWSLFSGRTTSPLLIQSSKVHQ